MDNSEKLATLGTQAEDKQNKITTQYVLDTQANTNKVNKIWALLQTPGAVKDEPNIVIMRKS
jgi:hypothetical protein